MVFFMFLPSFQQKRDRPLREAAVPETTKPPPLRRLSGQLTNTAGAAYCGGHHQLNRRVLTFTNPYCHDRFKTVKGVASPFPCYCLLACRVSSMNRSVSPRSGTMSLDQASAAWISGVHDASSAVCAQREAIGFDTTAPYCSV